LAACAEEAWTERSKHDGDDDGGGVGMCEKHTSAEKDMQGKKIQIMMTMTVTAVTAATTKRAYRHNAHLAQTLNRRQRRVEASSRAHPVLVKQEKTLFGRVCLGFGQSDTTLQVGYLKLAFLSNLRDSSDVL
jgi:hypothetical protein